MEYYELWIPNLKMKPVQFNDKCSLSEYSKKFSFPYFFMHCAGKALQMYLNTPKSNTFIVMSLL